MQAKAGLGSFPAESHCVSVLTYLLTLLANPLSEYSVTVQAMSGSLANTWSCILQTKA
jgi:hypothetical protein